MPHYSFIAASDADLIALNDPKSRSDIQFTLPDITLSELSALISLLGSGLTLNFAVNIESIKEIWSVAEPLTLINDGDVESSYKKWLVVSKRQDTANEKSWFRGLLDFIPEFNQADNPLIILEPKTAGSLLSRSTVSLH